MTPDLFQHKTTFERILDYIEFKGKITQLDSRAVSCTAITQRANDMIRFPDRYSKYLKGRKLTKRNQTNGISHFEEYLFEENKSSSPIDKAERV